MTHKLNNLLTVIQGFSSLIMMDEGLDERGIPVNIQCPTDVPAVKADPGRLEDILVEVLANAAEAAAEGGCARSGVPETAPPWTSLQDWGENSRFV